jgi:hypothetical protein
MVDAKVSDDKAKWRVDSTLFSKLYGSGNRLLDKSSKIKNDHDENNPEKVWGNR